MGFRPSDTVLIGAQKAIVTSISPNEITAIAPAAAPGTTGSVDIEIDDLPIFSASAIISAGLSYDSGNGDSLTLNSAPAGTVPIGVPIPFTVTALDSNLAPAAGVTVTFTVTSGNAALSCGAACSDLHNRARRRGHPKRDRCRRWRVGRYRIAHQRRQPSGTLHRRNAALSRCDHPPALHSRRHNLELDNPGTRTHQRHSRPRPDRHLEIHGRPLHHRHPHRHH